MLYSFFFTNTSTSAIYTLSLHDALPICIGDSPVIGAGTYANNKTCAISCTGHGEYFLRAVVAYDVSCLMEYKGLSLADACNTVVKHKLVQMGGEGGLIAVNAKGEHEFCFNSASMYRAMCNSEGMEEIAFYKA